MAEAPEPFRGPGVQPTPAPSEPERALQVFVGNIEDYAIILLDPNGRVTSWNSGAGRLKGYESRLSKEVGFDHHVVKPVDPGILMPLVARHRADAAWADTRPEHRGRNPS